MLKVRIIAAILAILLTIATAYAVPYIMNSYYQFVDGLSPQQQKWFTYSQIILGAVVAVIGFLHWKKKKPGA